MENQLNELLSTVIQIIIIPLLPAVAVLIGVYLKVLTNKIKKEINNDDISIYIDILERTVFNVVQKLNQTLVEELKDIQEGKLSPEQQKYILNTAKQDVLLQLNETQVEILRQVYSDLDEYITTLIESKVRLSKQVATKNS